MSCISRRKFLETSAKGAAVVSIPFVFGINPLTAMAGPKEGSLSDYYSHFGVNESVIRDIMDAALSRGGDYCDVFFQHRIYSGIGLEDNTVNRAYTNVAYGAGIRVIEGDQTGYSFTEEISPKAMKLAAKTAANIAGQSRNIPPQQLQVHKIPNYYPIETGWEEVGIDSKIPRLKQLNSRIFELDKGVIKSRVWFDDETSFILIATSDGRVVFDYQPMGYLSANCTIEENGVKESNGYAVSGRYGFDYYNEEMVDYIARKAIKDTRRLFGAVKPEPGEMPVILTSGGAGVLLHEAIGHGLEADCNRKGESIFADKMNKKVADEFVTVVDNGTLPGMRGSLNVDDEGNDIQETVLVENGILVSYMHDNISARHYSVQPTGNGRRESFRYAPIPRMRNTYMRPGPHKKEEIIKSVKKGIICESFTNGQVSIGPGDFSFYVKLGSLIEDGKVTRGIKDLNIIGNGFDVLGKVTMVADDLEMAEGGWTCGKSGQRVAASQGLPTCLVSSITVGGVS